MSSNARQAGEKYSCLLTKGATLYSQPLWNLKQYFEIMG